MAEPLPRPIPTQYSSTLVQRMTGIICNFLALFALPSVLRETDGYPLDEFLPVVICIQDESDNQKKNSTTRQTHYDTPVQVTGGKRLW